MLLEFLKEILPSNARVPESYYELKKIIKDLGMKYDKIDMCKNDCMLYWNDLKDVEHCPICGLSRFYFNDRKVKKIPHKVLRHFPLKPRLFMTPTIAKDMRWRKDKRADDDILSIPIDSNLWKQFVQLHLSFSNDPRNIRLGLSSDEFNPYNNMSNSYNMWLVILVPYHHGDV